MTITFELPRDYSTSMTYGLSYNLSHSIHDLVVPHESFTFHMCLLNFITFNLLQKNKIHIRWWLYKTKLLIGQKSFQIDKLFAPLWSSLVMYVCDSLNSIAMTLIGIGKSVANYTFTSNCFFNMDL